jgi:hypothetical protein
LAQWTCAHQWKTTTTRRGHDEVVRVRYLTCRRCGLKVKTEERLAVPWNGGDLLALVQELLPEGQAVHLRDRGITEMPLAGLNAILARHGLEIHTSKGRNLKRLVMCTDQEGRAEHFGMFTLRRPPPEASGETKEKRRKRR